MFKDRLRQLRKAAGLSQQKLAEQINSAQTTIAGWENGLREPDFQMLSRIADYFSVSVDYLLEDDDKKPQSVWASTDTKVKIITERLVYFRKQIHLPQSAAAAVFGVPRSTYMGYETGFVQPTVEILRKMARFYHTTVHYLTGLTDYPFDETKELYDSDHNKIEIYLDEDGIYQVRSGQKSPVLPAPEPLDEATEGNFIAIIGDHGTQLKIPVPPEKVERFKNLIKAGMPELLDEDQYKDL